MSEGFSATSTSSPTFSPHPVAMPPGPQPGPGGNGPESSATDAAKEQAGRVASTAKDATASVAGVVTEQAGAVTAEAGRQAKQLLNQARDEFAGQAATQQQRVATGLHALADELHGMVAKSGQDGVATDVARLAAGKAHDVADWLDDRDPGALLEEVRSYARRRPGAYLAIALGAGVLAGRLARGLTASAEDDGHSSTPAAGTRPLSSAPPPALGDGIGTPSVLPGSGAPGLMPGNGSAGADLWPRPTVDPEAELIRGGYPEDSVRLSTGAVDDDVPAVPVAPPPVRGLDASGVIGGPRGDLS